MKKLNQEQIKEIIELYQSGSSPKEIGEKLGIYNNSVTRILRKNGIKRNKAAPRVSDDNIQYIIKKYSEGVSSEIIAKELNIHSATVLRILKRNNISIRNESESKRKYFLNEDVLDNIDSEEKAYFLGLMWSDGNISQDKNDITIRLLSKDKDVLNQLSFLFYSQNRVSIYKNSNNKEIASLRITSKKIKKRLEELGCHPNKTFINKYPINLDSSLDNHFIRGVIDGDGSVLDYDCPIISLTGTEDLLYKISEIIQKELNINPTFSKNKKYIEKNINITYLSYKGFKKFIPLSEWLYDNAKIKMNRKYENYLSVKQNQIHRYESIFTESNINNKFNSGSSLDEISEEFNNYDLKNILQKNIPFNYGSTDIISYKENLLTKEYLLSLTLEEKNVIKNYLFDYFRSYGFPYPKYSDFELYNDWQDIKKFDSSSIIDDNKLKTKNYTGNKLTKHFFSNFYEVSFDNNKSMLDAFNDDGTLKKVIENRLGISYKETFNISGAMIRQGLRNSRAAMPASMFMTTVAKYIYDNFSEENGIVYDYSAGFGQRLVAAMASKNNLKYIGVEPWTKSFKNLNLLYRYIYQHHRCSLHNIGSENFYDENLKEKICLAFSSPPYFDTEIYCNESTQCNLGSYKDYLSYWEKTCENIYKMLKSGGYFILNISEKYKHDLIVICDKYFIHDRDLFLNYNTDKKYKNEPLIVMRKK